MSIIFSDAFTEGLDATITDGVPEVGTNWQRQGSTINEFRTNGSLCYFLWNETVATFCLANPVSTTPNDQSAEAVIEINSATPNFLAGVVSRYTDTGNTYGLRWNAFTGNFEVYKFVGGVETIFSSTSFSGNAYKTLKLSVVGSTVTARVDGSVIYSGTDTSHTSGRTGISNLQNESGTKFVIDSFTAESASGAAVGFRSYYRTR